MTSSQFSQVTEAEAFRNTVLADFEGEVDFVQEDPGPFNDRLKAEAEAGQGTVSIVGGLHGDFATFAADGLLADLSDLATELEDRGFVAEYLELGKLGGQQQQYIPWMQANYIMAARREALEYLPSGLTEEGLQTDLTYEQLAAWAQAIDGAEGPRFGLPASDDGLVNRFLQGYSYPSFTGGLNTTFKSEAAVTMWQWLKDIWQYADPQSVGYANMSDPLLSGSVWLAWDHTARLINALREIPDDIVTFPAPRGPEGLGYLPVLAGLGIPNTAPDMEGARSLIEYLTRPEVQVLTLQAVAFFPVVEGASPTELEAAIQKEADAVAATTGSEAALPSVLPIGLGDQNDAYSEVFRNAFRAIVLDGDDIAEVLETEGQNLQEVLNTAQATCWAPDPASEGVCQVG
jgi:multiple sugar transport system substrate-binding protein